MNGVLNGVVNGVDTRLVSDALMGQHQHIVSWLSRTEGLAPLHHLDLLSPRRVRQLLRSGADIHAKAHGTGASGSTPLQSALAITMEASASGVR